MKDVKICEYCDAISDGDGEVTHESWCPELRYKDDEEEYYKTVECETCGGDGKETCNNPDHGFIDAMSGDVGRIGCPCCGNDPKHKVKNGGICPDCNGNGVVAIITLK